ncbi:hypothetical protein GGX14DRAFT_596924 [Mycena pura]|uniref:Serine/threonine-protein phosphatase 2A activator n=1 Tax=Mycena pura TaxID=153505 RepID=A0AAD6Y4Z8_9AGAR|nr:hypothetical protein GGX14DRAFT_596924 [Mycena pura]
MRVANRKRSGVTAVTPRACTDDDVLPNLSKLPPKSSRPRSSRTSAPAPPTTPSSRSSAPSTTPQLASSSAPPALLPMAYSPSSGSWTRSPKRRARSRPSRTPPRASGFRTFYDRVAELSPALHATLPVPAGARDEAGAYFVAAWGSRTRIDYGSGMELNFLCWLCAAH